MDGVAMVRNELFIVATVFVFFLHCFWLALVRRHIIIGRIGLG